MPLSSDINTKDDAVIKNIEEIQKTLTELKVAFENSQKRRIRTCVIS